MKCTQVREGGKQCRANAMDAADFCYWHNPAISQEKKREATVRGGEATRILYLEEGNKKRKAPINIRSVHDLLSILNETINDMRYEEMEPKDAMALVHAISVTETVMKHCLLDKKIDLINANVISKREDE